MIISKSEIMNSNIGCEKRCVYSPTTTFSMDAKATSWSPNSTGSALSCMRSESFFNTPLFYFFLKDLQLFRGTHIWFGAVLGHECHSEVGTEEGPRQPASSFLCCQFLSHHNRSLKHTLTWQEQKRVTGWRWWLLFIFVIMVTVWKKNSTVELHSVFQGLLLRIHNRKYRERERESRRKFTGATGSGWNKHF